MNDTTEKPTTVEGEIVIESDSTKEDGNKDLAENHNSAALVPVTPNQLLAMAVEQGADVDKLEKLLQLQERWEANEAKKAFVAAMNEFKANPPEILKDKTVRYENSDKSFTEYDHASLQNVTNTIGAALAEHDISHRWNTEQQDGGIIRVTCILTHKLGHSESCWLENSRDDSGGKNNIQGIGSTITYLQRYTLLSITGTATKDQDDDGQASDADAVPRISEDQQLTIHSMIEENELNEKRILATLKQEGINSINEININAYEGVIDRLNNMIRVKNK